MTKDTQYNHPLYRPGFLLRKTSMQVKLVPNIQELAWGFSRSFLLIAIISIFLSACNLPGGTTTLEAADQEQVATMVVQTLAANITTPVIENPPVATLIPPTQISVTIPILNSATAQPPATSTSGASSVSFSAVFAQIHFCGMRPTVVFKITNQSNTVLESLRLFIEDATTGVPLYGPDTSNAPFLGAAGECPPGADSMAVGQTSFVAGALQAPLIPGQPARADIRLCTENDLGGQCESHRVEFKYNLR